MLLPCTTDVKFDFSVVPLATAASSEVASVRNLSRLEDRELSKLPNSGAATMASRHSTERASSNNVCFELARWKMGNHEYSRGSRLNASRRGCLSRFFKSWLRAAQMRSICEDVKYIKVPKRTSVAR
jgi:hypothetical protein